jgi:hypothetical protein
VLVAGRGGCNMSVERVVESIDYVNNALII